MGQLTGFLGKYLGLSFANHTIIPLIRHAFLLKQSRNLDFVQTYAELTQVLKMAPMTSIQCVLMC